MECRTLAQPTRRWLQALANAGSDELGPLLCSRGIFERDSADDVRVCTHAAECRAPPHADSPSTMPFNLAEESFQSLEKENSQPCTRGQIGGVGGWGGAKNRKNCPGTPPFDPGFGFLASRCKCSIMERPHPTKMDPFPSIFRNLEAASGFHCRHFLHQCAATPESRVCLQLTRSIFALFPVGAIACNTQSGGGSCA